MQTIKSDLFKKFKDERISKNAQSLIGGGAGPGSNSSGDTDCTSRNGAGSDCTDLDTDGIYDTDMTSTDSDGCVAPVGGGSAYGSSGGSSVANP